MRRRRRRNRGRRASSRRRSMYNRGRSRITRRRSRRNKGGRRSRKVSAYARFVGAKMRSGMSMKAAAKMWKKH